MFEGPSGNRKQIFLRTEASEAPQEKKAKKSGKTITKYSDYLQHYLDRKFSGSSILASPKANLKSLQELSIEVMASNPRIVKGYPPPEPFPIIEAGAALLFSPKLDKNDWMSQLEILKRYDAKVCGIKFSRFDTVDVVDLSKIQPGDVEKFLRREPNELIVVYGTCRRSTHLPISKGATVIGRDAIINAPGKSFKLYLPKAKISADPRFMNLSPNKWIIAKDASLAEINTDSIKFNAGYHPLVYLNQSNLVGVELDCQHVTQGIVGSRGNINISNNNIVNTRECGIFVHDCDSAVISGNQLHTSKKNEKIGISLANCKKCEQTENSVVFS